MHTPFPDWVLCHEYRRSTRRCATVREMKVGPSRSAIRVLISSHRKLLSSVRRPIACAMQHGVLQWVKSSDPDRARARAYVCTTPESYPKQVGV